MPFSVLIVDDSPVMREFIRRVIHFTGIEVANYLEASDGRQALLLLRKQPVDLVLTDINMPGMNGEELLRQMKFEGLLEKIPTLVVSTDATEQRIEKMLQLGARGYVTKPFSPEILRERLEAVLKMNAPEETSHAR